MRGSVKNRGTKRLRLAATLLSGAALFFSSGVAMRVKAEKPKRSVVVELFTSEGCSSCPPADRLLEKIDRTQPYPETHVIVLSEHVDYWNRIGWTDPFSQSLFSRRQEAYSRRLGADGPYTPQMIVDGVAAFVGSDAEKARNAILEASRRTKTGVRLSITGDQSQASLDVLVEADALPAGKIQHADIYFAVADLAASSKVLSGENAGRQLSHVAVVRDFRPIGRVSASHPFRRVVTVKLHPGQDPSRMRLVAFAQEPGPGLILGAASVPAQ